MIPHPAALNPAVKPERGTYALDHDHPLAAGLVLFHLYNEGGGARVMDAAGLNPGTFVGTTWGAGRSGPAVVASSAASQYVSVPHAPSLLLSGGYTVEFSIWLDALRNYNAGVTKTFSNVPSPFDFYVSSDGSSQFTHGLASGVIGATTPASTFAATTWYTVHLVFNGATARTLVNGRQAGSAAATSITATQTVPLWVGRRADGVTQLGGRVGYVKLYNRALTPTQILDSVAEPFAPLRPLARRSYSIPYLPLSHSEFTADDGTSITAYAARDGTTFAKHAANPAAAATIQGGKLTSSVDNSIFTASAVVPVNAEFRMRVLYDGSSQFGHFGGALRSDPAVSTRYGYSFTLAGSANAFALYRNGSALLASVPVNLQGLTGEYEIVGRVLNSAAPVRAVGAVRRLADGYWLSGPNTWSATKAIAFGVDDATPIAQAAPAANSASVWLGNPSDAGTTVTLFDVVAAPAFTYSLAVPATAAPGSPVAVTVTPDGPYSGTVTLTPSGAGISAPQTLTWADSAAPQTATFTPAVAGTLTVTGNSLGSLAEPAAATVLVGTAVPVADANLAFSPYNVRVDADEGYAQTNNPGASLQLKFTGASAAYLLMDPAANAAQAAGNCPAVLIRVTPSTVTAGSLTRVQLAPGQTVLPVATGLTPSTTYEVEVILVAAWYADARWSGSVSILRVTGVLLTGGTLLTPTGLAGLNVLVFADSEGEGYEAVAQGVSIANQDASLSASRLIGLGLGGRVGVVAFAGQGYLHPAGDVPSLGDTWDKYDAGHSRLTDGKFSPVPDYIVSPHGQNDGPYTDAAVTAAVAARIADWRAASGPDTRIVVCCPADRQKAAAIAAGVAASGDPLARYVDNPSSLLGTSTGVGPYNNSNHLNGLRGHPLWAARLLAGTRAAYDPVVPDAADVRLGVELGLVGETGLAAIPPRNVVLAGQPVDQTTGTLPGLLGDGQYPVNHSGGLGDSGEPVTLDPAGGTAYGTWAADALRITVGGVGRGGVSVQVYERSAYDATTGAGRVASTYTRTDGRWTHDLLLDSGDYYVLIGRPGDGYYDGKVAIRVP